MAELADQGDTGSIPATLAVGPPDRPKVVATYVTDLVSVVGGARPEAEGGRRGTDDRWRPVRQAPPRFRGHLQPRIPTRFGYYPGAQLDVLERQFALASRYGISAFCLASGWHPDREGAADLVDELVERPGVGVRYAVRWGAGLPAGAPESGMATEDAAEQAARHLARFFADERYLRLEDRPFLVLTGPVASATGTVLDRFRRQCEQLGVGTPYLAAVERGDDNPVPGGPLDAIVETPLRHYVGRRFAGRQGVGRVLSRGSGHPDRGEHLLVRRSYQLAMSSALARPAPARPWLRACLPGWDDTPLFGTRGTVLTGATAEIFGDWLLRLLERTCLWNPPEAWLVMAGTWNAWASGSYLEPDVDLGTARLEAVSRAVARSGDLAADVALAMAQGRTALLESARAYAASSSALAAELLRAAPLELDAR